MNSDSEKKPIPASLHSHVTLELVDPGGGVERLELDIVPDKEADYASGFLGKGTPLAKAVLGHPAGSSLPYQTEDIRVVRILDVSSGSRPTAEMLEKRKSRLKSAVNQIARTNAITFATTVEGKWGDYDADGVVENWKDSD